MILYEVRNKTEIGGVQVKSVSLGFVLWLWHAMITGAAIAAMLAWAHGQ